MISADNVLYLKNRFSTVWNQVQQLKDQPKSVFFDVVPSKSGEQTLIVDSQGKSLYVHSKYNPRDEAEQFIAQLKDVEQYGHVFFYGVGLGYHVEAFFRKYPSVPFTLYEPAPELFESFLSRVSLPNIPASCKHICLEQTAGHGHAFLKSFVEGIHEDVLLVQLPSYDRIFTDKVNSFSEQFKELLNQKKLSLKVNNGYEKRWILNSLINIEETIRTPNILLEKLNVFKDKPVIVVAAGPSLQDEMEQLRYIKEHGLAYILSVGTSINALLANGIHPDAACTYDPSHLNQKVFKNVNDQGITDIPLIFGSSVGFEVLKQYKGPKLHVLTNQDTIAPVFLKPELHVPLDTVHDASTITAIALQLLYKLQVKNAYLVGQNLAFRDNLLYTVGALVLRPEAEVLASDRRNVVLVESVHGEQIETTQDYMLMKLQIEEVLKNRKDMEVVNTTKGGAKIDHTTFVPLEEIIQTRLKERVVIPNWYEHSGWSYDLEYARKKATEMKNELNQLRKYYNQITGLFNDINRCKDRKDKRGLAQLFNKFDKVIMKIRSNLFFQVFIKPMNRVQEELLLKQMEKIRFENDLVARAELIIQIFGKFLYGCQVDTANITPVYDAIHNYILKLEPSE
ncbi:6-hydroxymethylpterin diphosphokinase MptE-like protein [Paenibacillus piri]|uniref:DUF115 domain-containing protein n=1 Tax=Paenibacillus piri TaxID=2547395 RepID=A0A4R5KFM4_9BACL|nr:6-hydroxymethylpterin diphosphokinase MptE-like protein [Paenibacillus piri]TDF93495.1 DUF115 domain-containing protein [Paenibacillus piri]